MATITRTLTVAAPIQQVWQVLADFGAISSWTDVVDHSCLLQHHADPTAVGTERRVQVGRDTLVERITDSTPPTVLAYDIEGLPRRLRKVTNRWALASATDGTTVTLTSTVDIGGNPIARIAEQAMCRFMAKQSAAMLSGLAARVKEL